MNKYNLEERLIDFAVLIIQIAESMPKTRAGNLLSGQLVKSGTSPALNYGEAQSGESRRDFIHKIKVVLKELRETSVCLKIIARTKLYRAKEKLLAP
jgi:four helix bundle protein